MGGMVRMDGMPKADGKASDGSGGMIEEEEEEADEDDDDTDDVAGSEVCKSGSACGCGRPVDRPVGICGCMAQTAAF